MRACVCVEMYLSECMFVCVLYVCMCHTVHLCNELLASDAISFSHVCGELVCHIFNGNLKTA